MSQPERLTEPSATDAYADDPAARAFDDLRAEVSVMRRALEALPHAMEASRPPDYSEDIGQVKQAVGALAARIEVLEKKPGLTMTPSAYAREISWAGQEATSEARKGLQQAEEGFAKQASLLEQWVLGSRTSVSQNRWLFGMTAAGFICGTVVTLVFAWFPFW